MNKRGRFWLVLIGAVLAVNLLVGYQVYCQEAEAGGEQEAFEKISVMMRVLSLIRKDYVDADKVDYEKLIYGALHGMVGSLDPFSDFMPPDQYSSMMENTQGEFGGLGVIITFRDDILTIVSPIENTPGSRAGLQPGDQIVKIEGQFTEEMKMPDAIKLMKGEPGTKVTITIYRPGTQETRDYTIERAIIPVESVKDARILPDTQVGYVRITQFSDPTAKELKEALLELEKNGAKSLILDVRNNPGGLLESAVDICSFFLKPKTLVVSTEGRQPSQKHELRARKGYHFPDVPIAILINGGSASAAEILSGCLKDWKRAVLVGEKTFGKGSVQNIIELPDGSALRLTTAMYYTPSRRVIHEHGIEPDIEVKLSPEEYERLAVAQHAIPGVDAVAKVEDRQLQRAVDVLESYEIYLQGTKNKFGQLRADAVDAENAEEPDGKSDAEGEKDKDE